MEDLARKYRPKKLQDLVGQSVVVQTLTNAIKNNKLHHAHLFVGQYGSGKTSCARILAATENCLVSPGLDPCGTCDNCKKIFAGTHTDVLEIDAASGAGSVKEVRKLKENALYNPIAGCKTKYFIIDEAQRLSQESNDALLKLIEEPPSRVRFVLSTTDIHKLRPAVQSRCQRHDIRQIYWAQISERLAYIAKSENIDVEEGALNLCARLAHGSMRNGIQNLSKLISFSKNGKVTTSDADDVFGTVSESLFYDLIDSLIETHTGKLDTRSGLKVINNILQSGAEFQSVYDGIANHLRNMLVVLTASAAFEFVDASQEGKKRLKEQCLKCQQGKKHKALLRILSALNESKQSVDYNISPEIALQAWLIKSVIFFNE